MEGPLGGCLLEEVAMRLNLEGHVGKGSYNQRR